MKARKLSRTLLAGLAMIDAWQKNGANVVRNKLPLPTMRTRMALVNQHAMTAAWEITPEGRRQLEALTVKPLVLEVNPRTVSDKTAIFAGVFVMTLKTTEDDFWLARVRLSEKQSIIAFPKFGVVGIGFEVEEDWNTNLPASCTAERIYDHIAHNKGDDSITEANCVAAIRLLQPFAAAWLKAQGEAATVKVLS